MRKFNLIFQEIVKFFLVFLFCYVWIRYFLRQFWLSIIISFVISLSCLTILHFVRSNRTKKQGLKLKEKEEAENIFLSLSFSNNPMDFFAKLAQKKYQNIKKCKDYIVIDHKEENVKTILYVDLSFDEMTVSKLIKIYNYIKKEQATKIVILCKEYAKTELIAFCENFQEKFVFLDEYSSYEKLYKYYDFFPVITHKYQAKKKYAFRDFLLFSLNKKRTKGYLLSAIIIIISSLFVPMTIYYCIISSLLVILAIVSWLNPYFNKTSEGEIL